MGVKFYPKTSPYVLKSPLKRQKFVEGEQDSLSKPNISTLLASVSITFALALIPMGFAWRFSTSISGTASDTDFYLLIQSSITAIFGIAIGYYSISRQPTSVARRWAQALGVIGILCCIIAPPMYLYLATIWSALVAFIAASIQAYMILQLAMATEYPIPYSKIE